MNKDIIQISTISELHQMAGFNKPTHPLISIINVSDWEIKEDMGDQRIMLNLYSIGMKDKSCGLEYGRNTYDFNEGVLYFTAPNQINKITKAQEANSVNGWVIFFHPDLIRNSNLQSKIDTYTFFDYEVHEALHLSADEENTLNQCVKMIQSEISERIDSHSQQVIINTLELLLNYSLRYYERQFNTRTNHHSDFVSQFHSQLKAYYNAGLFSELGIPTVDYLGEQLHFSGSYLSDLLKKETGLSTKEHINQFIVEKAKDLLLQDQKSISEIAYSLGFNYPHYFSRLFKNKTGTTPNQFKDLSHLN